MPEEAILLVCPRCGVKNRLPRSRMHDKPICGKCRTPLGRPAGWDRPLEISDQSFTQEVLNFQGTVVVDCWAPWCGPCRMLAPVIDALAREYAGRIKFAKLNTDENPNTAARYGIRSIPTLLIFHQGTLVDRLVGALPKSEIQRVLERIG